MDNTERLYLTKAALARAAGLDSRSKKLDTLEPAAHLVTTQNKRVSLYVAAFIEVLKQQQEEK
jgi:G3E family GTPase